MIEKRRLKLNSDSKIYIYCQAGLMTGGPEALHQLRYYMELIGLDAYMVYTNKIEGQNSTPERYLKYFPSGIKAIDENDIIDKFENCVITSESQTSRLNLTKNTQKVIWWLSVVNRDTNCFDKIFSIKTRTSRILKCISFWNVNKRPYSRKKAINLCASKFAYLYVTEKLKLPAKYLIEPISQEFLQYGMSKKNETKRKNIVAYNPGKPSKIMTLLLERKDFEYLPIQNMTPIQIIKAFRQIKLYVDFGNFPGPERIPKEAVYNGTNILVNYKNAAQNDFDIAIPDKYKIKDITDVEFIVNIIGEMLEKYDEQYDDFEHFRRQVDNLEKNFIDSINKIFERVM